MQNSQANTKKKLFTKFFWRAGKVRIFICPLFSTPATPRRVFSGVGGEVVYKIGPRRYSLSV